MYSIYLMLDVLPKSLNKKLRSHWTKNYQENNRFDFAIAVQTQSRKPVEPLRKASLTIISHYYRMRDYDGLVGSMKPVVDALVSAGVLHDDSWGVLGAWNVDQKFRPKKDGPLIEIFVEQMV